MSTSGLSGQRVCVTGASRGIGAHACEVFARDGAQVLGIARSQDELSDLRERLTGQGLFDCRPRPDGARRGQWLGRCSRTLSPMSSSTMPGRQSLRRSGREPGGL